MAVSVISSPDPHALSQGGRTSFVFQGAGRLATSGVKAVCGLAITGAIAENTSIVLRWNGINHTVIAKTAPAAPNEFPAGDGSKAYVDSLAAYFSSYFPVQDDFVVTRGQDIGSIRPITFSAKTAGAGFNFTLGGGVGYPYTVGLNTTGTDPLVRTQYSVYVELYIQKIGQAAAFEKVFAAPVETDESGKAEFDVGDLLHDQLEDDLPGWNFPQPVYGAKSARAYFIKYGEAYGTPLQIGKFIQDTTRHIYRGGADYIRRAASGTDLLALSQTLINGSAQFRALRLGSSTRYVRIDEPQFLSFINTTASDAAGGGIVLEVNLTFTDTTTLTAIIPYDRVIFRPGDKWTFPVGVTQLGLPDKVPANKALQEYTVQLVAVTDVSPVYRFVLNAQYEPYTRYFAYVGSLGNLETVATFGKGSRELTLFSEQAERYLPTGYDVAQGQFVAYDLQLQQQTEVTTGFRSAAELRSWADFYRSALKFHLRQAQALPIGIVSKSIKQGKDGDNLFAHSFQYQYQFRDDFYSVSAEDEAALGDAYPPAGFTAVGGGTVVVNPVTLVPSVDKTVPDVVRTLTVEKIQSFEQSAAKVDAIAQAKPLDEPTASSLFRRITQGISFVRDLIDLPNTRDGYGLSDVPTTLEAAQITLGLTPIQPRLSSWTGDVEPQLEIV